MTIETLNKQFGIPGKVQFHPGKGNLTTISVSNSYASADICLYGGQLLSYKPTDQYEVIWLSGRSSYEKGKAIRGGIPVCFPWFGPHPDDKTKPQHGFARLHLWEVVATGEMPDKLVTVTLGLKESDASTQLWPWAFNATIQFIIGKKLEVKFTVTNTDSRTFEYSDALHTYFNIGDIANIAVEGLQGATYYDAFGTLLNMQEDHLIYFNSETNRRYVNTTGNCIIHDKGFDRKIEVKKSGSKVTVVWNPAEATTKTMSDMFPDAYKTFVCVEPANAYDAVDIIELKPGDSHTLSTVIEIVK